MAKYLMLEEGLWAKLLTSFDILKMETKETVVQDTDPDLSTVSLKINLGI